MASIEVYRVVAPEGRFQLDKGTAYLPAWQCGECGKPVVRVCASLPQAESLFPSHALLDELAAIRKQLNAASKRFYRRHPEVRASLHLSPELGRELTEASTLTRSAFEAYCAKLRSALGLPADHPIQSGSRLGPASARQSGRRSVVDHDDCMLCARLVSARLVDWLSDQGYTGWSAVPAAVATRTGALSEYFELLVHGRGGSPVLTPQSSPCPACGFLRDRHAFRHDASDLEWDGSDWFCFADVGWVFVTERVVRSAEACGFANLSFERLGPSELGQ